MHQIILNISSRITFHFGIRGCDAAGVVAPSGTHPPSASILLSVCCFFHSITRRCLKYVTYAQTSSARSRYQASNPPCLLSFSFPSNASTSWISPLPYKSKRIKGRQQETYPAGRTFPPKHLFYIPALLARFLFVFDGI